MNAVVVVPFHDQGAFALDCQVVLGVNAGAGGIHFCFVVGVHVSVGLRTGASVAKRVGGAVFGNHERFAGHLRINGGVGCIRKRKSAQIQVYARIALGGIHTNLGIGAAIRTAKVVVAGAGDNDLAAGNRNAVVIVCNSGSASAIGNRRRVAVGWGYD